MKLLSNKLLVNHVTVKPLLINRIRLDIVFLQAVQRPLSFIFQHYLCIGVLPYSPSGPSLEMNYLVSFIFSNKIIS